MQGRNNTVDVNITLPCLTVKALLHMSLANKMLHLLDDYVFLTFIILFFFFVLSLYIYAVFSVENTLHIPGILFSFFSTTALILHKGDTSMTLIC